MRALALEPEWYGDELVGRLAAAGVETTTRACAGQADLLAALSGGRYGVVLGRLGLSFDAAVMDAAGPGLRAIATPTTGLSHIDEVAAAARGIEVLSLKGKVEFLRTITSTAEHTWGLILALARRIPASARDVATGHWRRAPFVGTELRGLTLGLLGLGRLGTHVARYGRAFEMPVLACDVRDEPFAAAENAHVERAAFDDVLARADVVSVHLPLDDTTAGIVTADRLARMRRTAVLVNTARGELIDEAALLARLRAGALAGAALDVVAGDAAWSEAVPGGHPLVAYACAHDNLILTPHIGGYTNEAIARTRSFLVDRVIEFTQRS